MQALAGWRGAARKGGDPAGMPPRGGARRLQGCSGQGWGMGRMGMGRIQSREEEGERFSSRKNSLGTRSLSQGCSREERGRTETLCPASLTGTRGPAALRLSPRLQAGPGPAAAQPYLPLQRDLVALQVLPAGAFLQQLCPQLVNLGTRTRHGLVLPHPSPPRLLGERSGPPQFLPMTPVPQSTGGLSAPSSHTAHSRCR